MSLIISNRLTDKQRDFLHQLEYYGNYNLTVSEAAQLIDELIEQRRLEEGDIGDGYYKEYLEYDGKRYDIF